MSSLEDMTVSAIRWERLSYGLALVAIAGGALLSNTERRLFGGPTGESAFAAVSPLGDRTAPNGFVGGAEPGDTSLASGGLLGRRRIGRVRPVGLSRVAAAAPSDAGTVSPGAVDGATPAVGGVALASNDAGGGTIGSRNGASFAADVGGLPAVGGLVTGGATPGSTTPSVTPTPVPTSTPTPIGSAVPESATWMMLIGGFALVGLGLRRRRSLDPSGYAA